MTRKKASSRAALPSPESIRAALPERFPLLKAPPPVPERARHEHAHVIGTTGGGKTKFLEYLIRQDIK
jgi:hypothetical protein